MSYKKKGLVMVKLDTYLEVELTMALKHYIEYCKAKGLVTTATQMSILKKRIEHSIIYLKPFNT